MGNQTTVDMNEDTVLNGAIALRKLLSSCLGPDGQHKLLVFSDKYIVTDDIHLIFDEIDLTHPAARFVARHAIAQKEDIGDGSLTTILLSGHLAQQASNLLKEGYLPATIENGFDQARCTAIDSIEDRGRAITENDNQILQGLARTAVNTSRPATVTSVVEAAKQIESERRRHNYSMDLSDFMFRTDDQVEHSEVELIQGTVLNRDVVHDEMPRQIENPQIAVLGGGKKAGTGIEERTLFRSGGSPGEGRTQVSFKIETMEDKNELREAEIEQVRRQVAVLEKANVDALFTTRGISDVGKRILRNAEIAAFRTLTETDAAFLARATGSTVIMDIQDMTPTAIGHAGQLTVDRDRGIVRVMDCPHGTTATLVVSGTLSEYTDERERDLRTGIIVVLNALNDGAVVPAGGGIESELAMVVRNRARTVEDRTAIPMEAVAKALEEIPKTLARNAGANPYDILTTLRASNREMGFDAVSGRVGETYPDGPLTTAQTVHATIDTAIHVAIRLVRIDDILPGDEDNSGIDLDDVDFRPIPERDFDY